MHARLVEDAQENQVQATPLPVKEHILIIKEKISAWNFNIKTYKSAGSLETHMVGLHGYSSVLFLCEKCNNTFLTPKCLTRHQKSHK